MTQDEIIRMALDIDGHMNDHARGIDLSWETLVEIVQTAVLAEREACAKVCDEWYEKRGLYGVDFLAKAIRARGEK